ncbi:MAG: D-2-hydroxyacid dehydrogenase [Planctomycetota bacterium]
MLKLICYPPVEEERQRAMQEVAAAGQLQVISCDTEQQAFVEIEGADAFFGKITPPLLAAARRLRWVQSATASLEHYIFPELVEHPCTLTNMRGLFSDVIADHVLGYILCFARNLHLYIRQQQQAVWAPIGGENQRTTFAAGPCFVSGMDRAHRHLSDDTLGIVGLGQIGQEVARRALAFGLRVLAVDPVVNKPPDGVTLLGGVEQLDDLLRRSDYVVICAPHTPATAGLFNAQRLTQMKSTGYLINIGRGAIVKLDDLVAALQAGRIAGAALDVFETEPLPDQHQLWRMPNVLITPHVAACSVHIATRHRQTLLENIRRFVAGEPLNNVVRKAEWF